MTQDFSQSNHGGNSWFLFLLSFGSSCLANTAAETDWYQGDSFSQCIGEYIEPSIDGGPAIKAVSDSATRIDGGATTLNGNVLISKENQQISADFLTIDAATKLYTAEGNIALREPGLLLKGNDINGSLPDNTAEISDASFLLHKQSIRGRATRIIKSRENELTLENGNFTTCDPESNVWQVTGKKITLKNAEGYGVARDATLKVKDVPVAYFPWFRFSLTDQRQSGVLTPSISRDSDNGTDIAIPYYFNLKTNIDATYTLRNMHKRGIMHEGELRYLNKNTANLMAVTFLPKDDIYDNRENITLGNDLTKQDRWLAHLTHQGRFGNWSSKINYTAISDIDYFHDLGSFTNTVTRFDRAIGQNDRPAILRTGQIKYAHKYWGGTLELRSFQELNQIQTKQYAVLPRLALYGRRNVGQVELSGLAQMTEFDKSDSSPEGTRIVLDGRVSWPMRRTWGHLTPSVRTIHREYSLSNTSAADRDSASLTTVLSSVDMGLIFERPTKFLGAPTRQTLEPRLYYLKVQEDYQEDLPSFDSTPMTPSYDSLFRENRYTGYDRIGDADQIALGLTTRYFSKMGKPRLSASFGQIFYFNDRAVNFGSTPGSDPQTDTSPVFVSFYANYRNLDVNAQYEYDTDTEQSNRGYISLRYRRGDEAILNFTYSMTDSKVQRSRLIRPEEETDLSLLWPVSRQVNLIGRWNYALDKEQTIESLLGVEYNACCWTARVLFRRNLEEPRRTSIRTLNGATEFITNRRADSGIYFEFQLRGLASLGGRLDSLLQDSIPGFSGDR